MKYGFTLLIVMLFLMSCGNGVTENAAPEEDIVEVQELRPLKSIKESEIHDTPENLVNSIFVGAKAQYYNHFINLCDPEVDLDIDMFLAKICNPAQSRTRGFSEYFGTGRIRGEIEIYGDQAVVPVVYGPNREVMQEFLLIKREDKWYLSGVNM